MLGVYIEGACRLSSLGDLQLCHYVSRVFCDVTEQTFHVAVMLCDAAFSRCKWYVLYFVLMYFNNSYIENMLELSVSYGMYGPS